MQQCHALLTSVLMLLIQPSSAWLISSKPCFPAQPTPVPRQVCFPPPTEDVQLSPWTGRLNMPCVMYRLICTEAVLWMDFQSPGQQFSHLSPSFLALLQLKGALPLTRTYSWMVTQPAPVHCLPTLGELLAHTSKCAVSLGKRNVHLLLKKEKRERCTSKPSVHLQCLSVHWNRLSRETVSVPCLEVSTLGCWDKTGSTYGEQDLKKAETA